MLGYTCIKEAYFLILKIQIYKREIFAILRVFRVFPIRHKWKKKILFSEQHNFSMKCSLPHKRTSTY